MSKTYFDKNLKKDVEVLIEEYLSNPSQELEEKIIKRVERYVFNTIRGPHRTHPTEDDFQEIRIGILQALRTFNPDKGKFLTWVIFPVKKRLYSASTRDIIHIPRETKEAMMRIDLGGDIDSMSEARIARAKKAASLKRLDVEPNEESLSDDNVYPDVEMSVDLKLALQRLPKLHRDVVDLLIVRQRSEKSAASELRVSMDELLELKRQALSMLKESLTDGED